MKNISKYRISVIFLRKILQFYSSTESRLTATMSPSRKVRGADYHGHDSHDEHSIGFPSIEGALMAISFLTFAVYLVRLVMVRNISFAIHCSLSSRIS